MKPPKSPLGPWRDRPSDVPPVELPPDELPPEPLGHWYGPGGYCGEAVWSWHGIDGQCAEPHGHDGKCKP